MFGPTSTPLSETFTALPKHTTSLIQFTQPDSTFPRPAALAQSATHIASAIPPLQRIRNLPDFENVAYTDIRRQIRDIRNRDRQQRNAHRQEYNVFDDRRPADDDDDLDRYNQPQPAGAHPPPALLALREHLIDLATVQHVILHKFVAELQPNSRINPFEAKFRISDATTAETLFWVTENVRARHPSVQRNEDDMECGRLVDAFEFLLRDRVGLPVVRLRRPDDFSCGCLCWPCGLPQMLVDGPHGMQVGSVQQHWTVVGSEWGVRGFHGFRQLVVRGPWFACRWCRSERCPPVNYKIKFSTKGREMGHIVRRKYSEPHQPYEEALSYQLVFPPNLEVEKKMLLIATLFLIYCAHGSAG